MTWSINPNKSHAQIRIHISGHINLAIVLITDLSFTVFFHTWSADQSFEMGGRCCRP